MKYTIDITDRKGKSFRIRASVPFMLSNCAPDNSTWKVLDEGFLKVRSGGLVNSSGIEIVLQPWVIGLTPGRVAWALDE